MFADRLVDDTDREVFLSQLSDKLGSMLDFSYHNLCPNKIPPIFGKYYLCIRPFDMVTDLMECHVDTIEKLLPILTFGKEKCVILVEIIRGQRMVTWQNTTAKIPTFVEELGNSQGNCHAQ